MAHKKHPPYKLRWVFSCLMRNNTLTQKKNNKRSQQVWPSPRWTSSGYLCAWPHRGPQGCRSPRPGESPRSTDHRSSARRPIRRTISRPHMAGATHMCLVTICYIRHLATFVGSLLHSQRCLLVRPRSKDPSRKRNRPTCRCQRADVVLSNLPVQSRMYENV